MLYTSWAIRRIHQRDHQSFILYLHPWELDPGQPRINGRWKSRLRHYSGLSGMEARLEILLRRGRFEPLRDLVNRSGDSASVLEVSSL
jgi:hypothetical protein